MKTQDSIFIYKLPISSFCNYYLRSCFKFDRNEPRLYARARLRFNGPVYKQSRDFPRAVVRFQSTSVGQGGTGYFLTVHGRPAECPRTNKLLRRSWTCSKTLDYPWAVRGLSDRPGMDRPVGSSWHRKAELSLIFHWSPEVTPSSAFLSGKSSCSMRSWQRLAYLRSVRSEPRSESPQTVLGPVR